MAKKETIYKKSNLTPNQYEISLNEALFHNANGYIGVRYDFEEGYPDEFHYVRSQYINGFYDYTLMKQAENLYGLNTQKQTMLNVADTQSIQLYLDDEKFNLYTGTVLSSELWLDMEKGITVRHVVWRSPSGKEAEIKITRMASFHQLTLFTIDYEVTLQNCSCKVHFESCHDGNVRNYVDPNDPRLANESVQYLSPVSCEIKDDASYVTSATSRSNQEVCSCVFNVLIEEHQRQFQVGNHIAVCNLYTNATEGQTIRLIKYATFCDTIRCDNPRKRTEFEMKRARNLPISELYQKQEEYLKSYWNNSLIEIDSETESNLSLRYSLYQIIQSVGKDHYSNIPPKGLSGDGYEGQYFWDSEMYIQPFLTITNPALSKKLLEYRYETLDLAKENAHILGHQKGALYPWRTIMGEECSGYFPSGSAQYHINGDIVYTLIAYYLATKDLAFLLNKGAEIVWETARLWMDTGCFYNNQFHINDVTGPDEYTCIVNNNFYTNLIAQYNLLWAVKIYVLLEPYAGFQSLKMKMGITKDEILSFQEAAQKMYLPYDDTLHINPQDDSFLQKRKLDLSKIPSEKYPLLLHYHPLHLYRHQVCKQADTIMAHFILEDAQSIETMRRSYEFYETITTHDSSLSYCIFGIMAARLGLQEKAFSYYELASKIDLTDQYKNTDDGVHVANMGGIYMTIVYGFGGFRLKEDSISIFPLLPKQWNEYKFKITYEGSRILIHVRKDDCLLILETGEPKEIVVFAKPYLLETILQIPRPK